MTNIDACTVAVTALDCRFGALSLSTATGFIWKHGDEVFLVTNWHVVTGRHPNSGQHLSPNAGEPDHLHLDVFENKNLNRRATVPLQLYGEDGAPVWLEHPKWRSAVDVVCVPLGELGNHVFPLNEVANVEALRLIGMDVFVLGYPRGIGPDRLAIWKRASIASEPDVDVDKLPLRLIDTSTAEGMSGAPVVQRFRGQAMSHNGGLQLGVDGYQMFGVYSGRLPGQNETEVTLGRVWKEHLVAEIAIGGVAGCRDPRGVEPAFGFTSYLSQPGFP
ncbi:MAG: trypsin-like peptidase domain-containing protein [Brevundimonas sp.]